MHKSTLIILMVLFRVSAYTQVAENKYRLFLTDKDYSIYSIDNPNEFLSEKSIERRVKQDINIQFSDLPVSDFYIDSLKKLGLTILNTSRWFNTVVVYSNDPILLDTIHHLGFVKSKQKTNSGIGIHALASNSEINLNTAAQDFDYGNAVDQIGMINGHVLHHDGYMGQGMTIAVIDAGFKDVDLLAAFDSLWSNNQIKGTKDFVEGDSYVFDASDHGMKVLSIMGANIPGVIIGTAPKANYWLLRSEDGLSEFSIEEDNWLAAAEFADSVGADIINSSLGYAEFDDVSQNYTYANMNGNTAYVTKAADMAASKGILVVTSAGNLGDDPWKYISAPADGDSVLTVGAVDKFATYVNFSGQGPTSDGRIKPNVCALGYQTSVQGVDGSIVVSNGTSFSSPIIAGMAACLWQYYPEWNNMDILHQIEKSAHLYSNPNNRLGYGIPDFGKAAGLINTDINLKNEILSEINIYPNPFHSRLYVELLFKSAKFIKIDILNMAGEKIKSIVQSHIYYGQIIEIENLEKLTPGIYILKVHVDDSIISSIICKL